MPSDGWGYAPTDEQSTQIAETSVTTITPMQPNSTAVGDYGPFLAAAKSRKRDIREMLTDAQSVGRRLAADAFYQWRQGGASIQGPSIKLAYALAQVWGSCVTQCAIVSQQGGRVHLKGRYVDLQTLAIIERDYISHMAPAPGKYAEKPDQADRWAVMQMQSAVSKAVRGAILGGLPAWFVDAAMTGALTEHAERVKGGRSLPDAIVHVVGLWVKHGVTEAELEVWVGQIVGLWTLHEVYEVTQWGKAMAAGNETLATLRARLGTPVSTPAKGGARMGIPDLQTEPTPDIAADIKAHDEARVKTSEEMLGESQAQQGADKASEKAAKASWAHICKERIDMLQSAGEGARVQAVCDELGRKWGETPSARHSLASLQAWAAALQAQLDDCELTHHE